MARSIGQEAAHSIGQEAVRQEAAHSIGQEPARNTRIGRRAAARIGTAHKTRRESWPFRQISK